MRSFYLKLTLNTVIFTVASFFIFFVIFYYFCSRAVAVTLAIIFSLLLALVIVKINFLAERKRKEKADKENKFSELFVELSFMPKSELISLFCRAYEGLDELTVKRTDYLYLPDRKKAVFFFMSFDGLKKSDVVKAFNKINKGDGALIFSSDCNGEVKEFATRFDDRIKIATKQEIFNLLNDSDTMPKIKHRLLDVSTVKKVSLKEFLDRKKAVKFLALGFAFLFFSFFVPIKGYYIACGTILSAFSLFVLFFVKPEEKEN